ncbi:glycoside hydrolase family 18 protein [Serpula lacrymans var. lacrymans S7.3]|uniref:Glycoside hydrolase family 18 protein n=2 Tax=Serpula lacrymans var. lacrymans TaxID=341189 RepID=F8PQ99_SERL3|nr:glycoside hydrolase family 18 protein [Serpula lacrymans var. lacrymans S7.9]EGO02200.1 glycoside hydrolase family 18 protein [Serpula lacrymans var. lacrymans S7.3]EGO27823.1 glycoside hydrolase family 18 protein [Serpula lacrymans var. lacrymans S7.9]
MSPEQVDYSKFDVVDFAFALPNANYGLDWDTTGAPGLLARVVKAAHAAGKKAKLSIGGWTGSGHFSTAVSTAANRQIFVNNILQTYKQYDLDGIDIDWEYPGQQGEGSNAVSPADSQDMLQFLQLLRQALPPLALITAAVQTEVLAGPDGKPLTNVSDFAKVLNWVLIMNYDTYETASPPGPNAPLYDSCKSSRQPKANAVAAYNAWTNAGFPADQLVLGLPSYGYVISSSATALRERSESQPVRSLHQLSRRFAATPADDSGQIQFRSLVSENILTRNADGSFAVNPSSGFTRQWDACSATPFLTSASAAQTIPYDDPQSLAIKAKWVKDMGMGGVNLFDVHGDTSQWDLVNTVRTAMGVV